MTITTSILLTTYNRDADCITCLSRLLEQCTDEVEIILLNDLHLDSNFLKAFCVMNGIKYIHTGGQKKGKPHWRVPGFALNIGAKQATGDYLIIGNAEIYQISDNTVGLMRDTGIVAYPRVWDQPNKNASLASYKKFNQLRRLPFFMGVPKSLFLEIGGYDEDFTGYAGEDGDLVRRLDKASDYKEINADVVHLWNVRGMAYREYAPNLQNSFRNKDVFGDRNTILRNEGREWGIL